MIKLSVLYPNGEGKKFDKEYYLNKHMPLSIKLQGSAIKSVTVETGISGGVPGSEPPFVVICNFMYESMESFIEAFMPHAEVLMDDIKNYTDIGTVIQFSEVHVLQ